MVVGGNVVSSSAGLTVDGGRVVPFSLGLTVDGGSVVSVCDVVTDEVSDFDVIVETSEPEEHADKEHTKTANTIKMIFFIPFPFPDKGFNSNNRKLLKTKTSARFRGSPSAHLRFEAFRLLLL